MVKLNNEHERLIEKLCDLLEIKETEGVSSEDIYEHCKIIKEERDKYYMAMDNCIDSFHLTDGNGNVIFINKSFERRAKLTKEQIIGRNVIEMEREGIYRPSAVRIALQEKRQLTMVQSGPGGDAIVTVTPIVGDNGETIICVSNARFINDLKLLENYYEKKNKGESLDYKNKKIISEDETMLELYEFARQIAKADSGILISGETGTGKSMIARYIHDNSERRKGKFVELNCASIPENLIESELFGYETGAFTGAKKGGKPGLFELAEGGTLFLDEIGDMPMNLQAKLLHAIQNKRIIRIGGTAEKNIDVRIITATNKNLEKMIHEGRFRSDLYYRINIVPLYMPALRERKKDINGLIGSFLQLFNKQCSKQTVIMESALELLNQYRWPGNIRELENLIERLVVTDNKGVIEADDLPNNIKIMTDDDKQDISIKKVMPLKKALYEVEKQLVELAFKEDKSTYKVAKSLEISQSGASRKYLKYIKNDESK